MKSLVGWFVAWWKNVVSEEDRGGAQLWKSTLEKRWGSSRGGLGALEHPQHCTWDRGDQAKGITWL